MATTPVRSGFEVVGQVGAFDDAVIAHEPHFWLADWATARAEGGPITQAFLDALPDGWRDQARVLSRVAWVGRGWRAQAAPFHCDNLPRRPDGEQDFTRPRAETIDTLGCVMGACLTDFAVGAGELPIYPLDHPQTTLHNVWLDGEIAAGRWRVQAPTPGALFRFGWGDFHRAGRATRPGWRILLRAVRRDQPERVIPPALYRSQYCEYVPETPEALAAYGAYAPDGPPPPREARAPGPRSLRRLGSLASFTASFTGLTAETPLFAATPAFAAEVGGPITRAFVEGLPSAWRTPGAPVVVDSELVWLRPGDTSALPIFHREPFPRHAEGTWLGTARRHRGDGMRRWANEELAVTHRCCTIGAGGAVEILAPAPTDAIPLVDAPGGRLAALLGRDAALQAEGRATERVASGEIYEIDGATLWRALPAAQAGFSLRLRATLGTARAAINARRNLCAP